MEALDLKQKYLNFFVKKGHKKLPNVSLVPEDVSSSALFISAGMHPLIPHLLGEPHALGKRLVSLQRCLRTTDIEEVGDLTHLTFLEMLGNWSLGDYWKEEALSWSWEFLIKVLNLSEEKIHVSCFAGDKDAPKDEKAAKIWKKLGVPRERIHFFGKKENWWGPVEAVGPCGPSSEMFVDMGGKCRLGRRDCNPSCQCGKYFEIWNDVFMEYVKTTGGKYKPSKQRNIDTGMGVERTLSVLQGKKDIFQIDRFAPIIRTIESLSGQKYQGENLRPIRIVAEHLRAAVFVIADGITPSNAEQGYVLRRLIRRAIFGIHQIDFKGSIRGFNEKTCQAIVDLYASEYPNLKKSVDIKNILIKEVDKFERTLAKGIKFLQKQRQINDKVAFDALQSFGIPFDITLEIAQKKGQKVDRKSFDQRFSAHQKISRAGMEKKFKGGLADHSGAVTRLHSATHLLHQALRDVLGDHVRQIGSNITSERLRFDFTHPEKLTKMEIQKVEKIINEKIKADLPVKMETMNLKDAKKKGALALFAQRYGKKVKTYAMGDYSFEVCGGPHVSSTGEIQSVKIVKEKAVGTGRRRLYLKLKEGNLSDGS